MKLTDFSKKPNVVIIITDQEREVMHWGVESAGSMNHP